ncbi:FlgO family outer membrane protein [Malaciobacter sp. WC5094]|uniref:FlgO family outer membrane protein n=1 Tax=Arcobacter sp. YIC-80 TaxID=3376683 RepID=UPI00384B9BD8
MLKTFAKTCLVATATMIFSGCQIHQTIVQKEQLPTVKGQQTNNTSSANLSTNHLQQTNNEVQVTKEYLKIANDQEKFVTKQYTLEGTINSLATQMMRNQKLATNKPVIITSFVRLDQFKKTTEFGRIVSESLINELSNKGFNIIEFRGQLAVSVDDKGEYFITRKVRQMKGKTPNTYVVVGTYSRQYKKVILNARVIDNITGRIITSARSTYHHGRANDCMMFSDCKPARTVQIVKEH